MQEIVKEATEQVVGTGLETESIPKLTEAAASATADQPRPARSPMRVVHVIKHCGYGNGSVHVAVDLACVQAQCGDDVTFVSCGGTFDPLLQQYKVRTINLPHDQSKPFSMLRAAWKLAAFARRTRPDVLHAHMMSSAIVGYIASKLSGVPLVTTVHNSFDKHSALMRLGRRVVAVSQAERQHLLSQGYKSRKLVAVMNAPNKSPRELFMHNTSELQIERPCIVTTSALHRRKGVFDVIEACSQLFPDIPGWKLYVAGEGPDRMELEEQARSLGLSDRIIFLGFVPEPRLLLNKADIFVLASYADPCSLAVGEARAAGCAIVATNVGGTPEMLEFGRAGRLVFPGKPKQLASELRRLMLDDREREKLGRASLLGSEIFDVQRLVNDYEAVYRDARRR